MKKWVLALLCVSLVSVSFAASDKYLVEQNLNTIAQTALDSQFGEGNFIVRIQVNMTDSKYSVKYTQQSDPKMNDKKGAKEDTTYILPGVPALKNLSPGSMNQLPYDSVTTMVEPKLRNMLVYVLANKNYPKSQAKKAETTIKDIVGFNTKRGDKFKMEFQPFYEDPNKETQNITIVPGAEKIVSIQNLFYLLFMIMAIVALVLYVKFKRQIIAKDGGSGSAGPSINVNPNLELPEGLTGGGGGAATIEMGANIKRYFDFVTDSNIEDLIFLVKNQKLKLEYISLLVSFLPSRLGARLMKSLPIKDQAQIVGAIADQRLGNRALIERLDKKLKADIECFVGGGAKLSAIADMLSVNDRKSMLTTLKKSNPTDYKKVRTHILIFDDLLLLDQKEIQLILSEINLEALAISLVSVDQQVFDYVMENLTGGAKDMVNQYLELKSERSSQKQIETAQDDILKIVKRFEKNGKIDLKEKLAKA